MRNDERYLTDAQMLEWAIERSRTQGNLRSDIAVAGHALIQAKRYEEALRVFDALLEFRSLEGHAYCNALWVVQNDNTRLPHDPARARRYLAACLPLAPSNPPIHLNASGVLCELGDHDGAITQLLHAAYAGVDITPHLGSPLFAPLKAHPRWREVKVAAARPSPGFVSLLEKAGAKLATTLEDAPLIDEWIGKNLQAKIPADVLVTALVFALDHPDLRSRQSAVRALLRYACEDGDDGHGGRPQPWLARWFEMLRDEIEQRVPIASLAEVIVRDLNGPFGHHAASHVHTFAAIYNRDTNIAGACEKLLPALALAIRDGDCFVQEQAAHAVWHFAWNEALRAVLRERCVPVMLRQVEQMATEGSIADFSHTRRELLRLHVDTLGRLDAGAPVGAAVARLAENARAETADMYLQGDLVKFVGAVREASAAPALTRIVTGEARTPAYAAAVVALGALADVRAIPALTAALRTDASNWPARYNADIRLDAALSLLQLGSVAGAELIIDWLDAPSVASEGQRLDVVLGRLTAAAPACAERHVAERLAQRLQAAETQLAEAAARSTDYRAHELHELQRKVGETRAAWLRAGAAS